MGLNVWEILILLLIVMIIFGAGKLPQVMGDLGRSIRSFKAGLKEDDGPAQAPGGDAPGGDAPRTPARPTEVGRRPGTNA